MRLFRLFAASVSLSLVRALAYRTNLVFAALMTTVGVASGLATLGIVFSQTPTLGGWSRDQAIVLLGAYQILSGLLAAFIQPNLMWFPNPVREGKLDDVLLKPAPSLYLVSLGSCEPLALTQVALGTLVLLAGPRALGTAPSLEQVAGWLVLLAVPLVVTWASRVLVAALALWAPGLELDVLYGALWQLGRYPVTIYRQPLRFILTYTLPVAFISTFPALALTRSASGRLLGPAWASACSRCWRCG
jgi:ABC-2 type transport system permease protein